MSKHAVVSREEWLEARKALLAEEKALTRQRDALCAKRRELPWVKLEKDYTFEGPGGPVSLASLFGDQQQLIVYHFMFAPGWTEGCPGCSLLADHFDGALQHVPHGGAAFAVVSRAPYAEFAPYQQRMGWKFLWVSSNASDFNFDFDVSFTDESLAKGTAYYNYEALPDKNPGECPGVSVFWKDEDGAIYHTYSAYTRGMEEVIGAFMLLDLTPLGRNETSTMNWVRRHDQYEAKPQEACGCPEDAQESPKKECCGTAQIVALEAPEIVESGARSFAGLSERVAQSEAQEVIPGIWSRFKEAYPLPHAVEGAMYGICTNPDGSPDCRFDYLACAEVSDTSGMPDGITTLDVAPARYAVFTYNGPIWNIKQVYQTIYGQWLPSSGHRPAEAPTLERYTREHDPVTGETTLEIWLPIQS